MYFTSTEGLEIAEQFKYMLLSTCLKLFCSEFDISLIGAKFYSFDQAINEFYTFDQPINEFYTFDISSIIEVDVLNINIKKLILENIEILLESGVKYIEFGVLRSDLKVLRDFFKRAVDP